MTFPSPTELDPALVEVRNERTAAMMPCDPPTWNDIPSDVGSGQVVIGLADASTIVEHDMLTARVNGVDAFSFKAQRDQRRTLDPEPTQRTITWSGAGVLDEWSEWIVTTPNPIGTAPEGAEVRYDWTSCDITGWDDATERSVVGDRTALPPDGLAGLTDDMPNPLAYWLAPRAAVPDSADPTGVFYVGVDFTLDDDTFYVPYWLADDLVAGALDDVLVSQFVERENMASHTRARLFPVIPAGDHRWRWKVENVARDHPQNCGLFAFAAAARTFTGVSIIEDWIHTSSVADGFKTLDYGEDEPGRTWGYIIGHQFGFVPPDLPLSGWTLDFSPELDSADNPWPIVQQRFRTGLTLLEMMKQGAAAGQLEFVAVPGERTLRAYAPGSAATGPNLDWHDLRDLEHDTDRSSLTGRMLARTDDGRLRWFGGATGPAAFAEIGGVDSAESVTAIAEAQIDRLNEASTSVTFTHLPEDPADGLYNAYRGLDILGVPNPALDGHDAYQVKQISVQVDQFGRLQPSVTVASRRRLLQERQEVAARRQTPGVKSDAVAPASPLQPQEVVLERWTEDFTWSGKANSLTVVFSSPWEIKRPLRIHRMDLVCLDDDDPVTPDGDTTSTVANIYSNGSPLPLGLGVVTLADGERTGSADLIYLAQPGEEIVAVLTSLGTHFNGTLNIYGAYLPQ